MTKRRELIVSLFERVESDVDRGTAASREQAPAKREEPTSAFALDGFVRRAADWIESSEIVRVRDADRDPARQRLRSLPSWNAISSGKRAPSMRAVVGDRFGRLLIETNERRVVGPNQAPEPTTLLVMPRAFARVTPSKVVAHL